MSAAGERWRAPGGLRPLVYASERALRQAEALGFEAVLENAVERALAAGRAYRRRMAADDDSMQWLVDLDGGLLAVVRMAGLTPQGAQRWRAVSVYDRDVVNRRERSVTR